MVQNPRQGRALRLEANCRTGWKATPEMIDVRNKAYCPVHEYEWTQCCPCCRSRRQELRQIDNELRIYWYRRGLTFADRGRSEGRRRIA